MANTVASRKGDLRAPRTRVWRAIANAQEFGAWFGVKLEGHSQKDHLPGYEHVTMEMQVERIEPERISPIAGIRMDRTSVDYSSEPSTLVEFQLDEVPGGTILRSWVWLRSDSLARRAEAFRMNDGG